MHGAAEQSDDIKPGASLGPYELIAPVGSGGMARVWAARHRTSGEVVALKMLLPTLAENVSFQQMFVDEARIASRVRHPNVCATFQLGEHDGIRYLAMEWIDGPSVMRLVAPNAETEGEDVPRNPFRPRLAARIIADACAGLHAAHELSDDQGRPLCVVHRDVSPHNILITSQGQVKVTDFGVAKALGKSHITIAGQLKGKLAYMAPEQLIGGNVDRRSDVFALGGVLYEITVGRRPFQGEHDPQVMAAIVMGRYDLPVEVVAGFPPALSDVIVRALANEPDDRFATAEQMRVALERYLEATGPRVTAVQIASMVHERCPPRAERFGWTAGEPSAGADGEPDGDTEPEGIPHSLRGSLPPPSETFTTMELDERPPSSRRASLAPASAAQINRRGAHATTRKVRRPPTQSYGWLGLAVLLGAMLGVGVLRYVKFVKKSRAASLATLRASPVSPEPKPSAVSSAPMLPSSAREAVASAEVPSVPPPAVRIHVTPASATLLVDGVEAAPGLERIARLEDGGSTVVTVRADGHEDAIVVVDPSTPDEVEVALMPVAPPDRPTSATAARTSPRRDGGRRPREDLPVEPQPVE